MTKVLTLATAGGLETFRDEAEHRGYLRGLETAMEVIQREREKAATDFTSDRCKGQRGQDRTDTFYDAYEAVRKLKS